MGHVEYHRIMPAAPHWAATAWRRLEPDTDILGVRAPDWTGGNVRVAPLCGPPWGHGRTYGGGVPRLGRAPPCPPWGDRRRRPLAPCTGRGHGAGGRRGVGSRHRFLRSNNANIIDPKVCMHRMFVTQSHRNDWADLRTIVVNKT